MSRMAKRDHEEIIVQNETAKAATECHSENDVDVYPVYLIKRTKKRNLSVRKYLQRRVVHKNGTALVHRADRPWVAIKYINDLANTLINSDWKWTLVALSAANMLTWVAFACVWMMISASNGDLDMSNGTATAEPCLSGIQGFAGYLLFSIESQTSIGYGNRYITHYCPEAALLLCIQIIAGVGVCGLIVGLVFQKIKGPRKINAQNSFSKFATICLRDGELCLIFRVRDRDRRYQCQSEIKAYVVLKRGEELSLKSIKLEPIGLLIWPVEVVHRITETSPFWDLSARDLILKRFEIIASLEGTSLSTNNTSNSTTSYISKEIRWGHTFNPCVSYDTEKHCYVVTHKLFNSTKEVLTPLCSARRLQEVFSEISSVNYYSSSLSAGNSPCLSDDTLRGVRRISNNGNSDSIVTISPVTVHASIVEDESLNSNGSRKGVHLDEHGVQREKLDALLVSLQDFIKIDQSEIVSDEAGRMRQMASYKETDF